MELPKSPNHSPFKACLCWWQSSTQSNSKSWILWRNTGDGHKELIHYGFISCTKREQEHCCGQLSAASVLGQMTSAWPRKVLFSPCCCYFIPSSNQALGADTCLWRLRLSISERTQPTLPSPPQTRIRKVSNFWNKRKLQRRERKKQEGKTNQLLQKEIIIPI